MSAAALSGGAFQNRPFRFRPNCGLNIQWLAFREETGGTPIMGGINIYCPPFVGRDKSGTPFEAVLDEISEGAGQEVQSVVRGIDEMLEIASSHILIEPADAAKLIDPLRTWIEARPNDTRPLFKECAEDLFEACRTAVSNGGPVALVW